MSVTSKSKETNSVIKELNKEWRDYTKKIDSMISVENIRAQKNVTFIIRRKKGCDVSLCDIIEAEMKKLEQLLDNMK
jgi:ribulose bisphosphate carboxylase small subunit